MKISLKLTKISFLVLINRSYKCCNTRIDISDKIDPANSKKCFVCHYCLFNRGFNFQDSICNGCHDFPMLCLNVSDIVIITVKDVDYRSIFMTLANLKQLIC